MVHHEPRPMSKPQVAPRTATPAIDPMMLDELRRLNSPRNPSFLARLISKFFESSYVQIAKIEEGLASRNEERVRFAAHALKGNARQMGANTLAGLCERLLRELDDEQTCTQSLVHQIRSEHARACHELMRA